MKTKKQQQIALTKAICLLENVADDFTIDALKSMLLIDVATCYKCNTYDINNFHGENYFICTNCDSSWQTDSKR